MHLLFFSPPNLNKIQEDDLKFKTPQKPCGPYLANENIFKMFLMMHYIAMRFFPC